MPIYNRYYTQGPQKESDPEHLKRVGPRLQVEIHLPLILEEDLEKRGIPSPGPITGLALIDTGASITAVDREEIINKFNIQPIGITEVVTPSGRAKQNIYPVSLSFPGTSLPRVPLVIAVGSELKQQNFVVLIGRDILSHCVLVYNGTGAIITLSV